MVPCAPNQVSTPLQKFRISFLRLVLIYLFIYQWHLFMCSLIFIFFKVWNEKELSLSMNDPIQCKQDSSTLMKNRTITYLISCEQYLLLKAVRTFYRELNIFFMKSMDINTSQRKRRIFLNIVNKNFHQE